MAAQEERWESQRDWCAVAREERSAKEVRERFRERGEPRRRAEKEPAGGRREAEGGRGGRGA
jgi:hypothetical protein